MSNNVSLLRSAIVLGEFAGAVDATDSREGKVGVGESVLVGAAVLLPASRADLKGFSAATALGSAGFGVDSVFSAGFSGAGAAGFDSAASVFASSSIDGFVDRFQAHWDVEQPLVEHRQANINEVATVARMAASCEDQARMGKT
ncbi:MAG: hypothetical protein B7X34_09815 [Acidobacteriia bacterium 12-62-4]|nr:MAG: hypothetical protein B7X34_09815 [Acidobacteriia bacterium 12-62-4]